MRRFLKYLSITLLALVIAFAGFVWWKLQPFPDPQPLPASLISVNSDGGQQLLADAGSVADYSPLSTAFEEQSLKSYCGVASSVTVLKALGHDVDQSSFFTDETAAVRSRVDVTFGGMSLPQLAGLLQAHDVAVDIHHAEDSSLEEFRETLRRNLSQENDYVLVNYQRKVLGQGAVGHISPLAAYDEDSDKVLVLDTAGYKYPPTWVPVGGLFNAMSTTDSSSGKTRGFLEVRKGG